MPVDVLDEVLTTLELSSQLYFRAELSQPFSIAVPEQRGVIRFHVAVENPCSLRLPDHEPSMLAPGDLVLVPHGAPHVLADDPERPARPLPAVLEETGFDGEGPLVYGGDGPRTVLVCGHFAFAGAPWHPLLTTLPPILHLRAAEDGSYEWLELVVRRIERELRAGVPGSLAVIRRLSEILLVEVLRAYALRGDLGALAAIADPQLGRALQAIHAGPAADWSLDALARIAGQSRTLFVERFRERLGTSPMRYLSRWRLLRARHLLGSTDLSVAEVAQRVGYASESAFHRAFRAEFGAPPGRLRRGRPAAT